MRHRRPPAALAVLAAGLLICLLSGCGGLPLPVGPRALRTVTADQPSDDQDAVRRFPAGPRAGETAADVVRGFLAAGADATVAREFLAPGTAWDATTRTTVYRAAPEVTVGPDGAAVARLSPALTIADDGSTRPGGVTQAALRLTRVAGAWRIASLPNGSFLAAADLPASYRRATLAWLDADRRSLVRDSVLLATDLQSLVPDVVATLLAGPPPRLQQAGVTTSIPSRLQLLRAAQQGSTVSIELQGLNAPVPAAEAPALRAQLAATLLTLPGVTSVTVSLGGQPLFAAPSVSGAITATDEVAFDRDGASASAAFAVTPGGVQSLLVGAAAGRASPGPRAVATSPAAAASGGGGPAAPGLLSAAVAADALRVAELRRATGGATAVVLPRPGGAPNTLGKAAAWSSVSWGADDTLWLVRDGQPVVLRGGELFPAPSSVALAALLIAPDGVHAAGLTAQGSLVEGLVRSAVALGPPALLDLHPVATGLANVIHLALQSSGTGRVLVADGSSAGTAGLWLVDIDAPETTNLDQAPDRVVSPCAGSRLQALAPVVPRDAPLLATCADGRLRTLNAPATGWSTVGTGLGAYAVG